MERSSAAVNAVRRLRSQAPPMHNNNHHHHQQQQQQQGRRRWQQHQEQCWEKEEDERDGKKKPAGRGASSLPELLTALVLVLYLLALRWLVHLSFQQLVTGTSDPAEFNAPRAR